MIHEKNFENLVIEAANLYPSAMGVPIVKELLGIDLSDKELVLVRDPNSVRWGETSAVGLGVKGEVGPPKQLYTIKFINDEEGNSLVLSEAIDIEYAPLNTNVRINKSNASYLKVEHDMLEKLNVVVAAPNGNVVEYAVPCGNILEQSLDALFNKELFLFIAYLFYHEQLQKISAGKGNLEELEKEYAQVLAKFREVAVSEKVDIKVELSLEAIMASVLMELAYEFGKKENKKLEEIKV